MKKIRTLTIACSLIFAFGCSENMLNTEPEVNTKCGHSQDQMTITIKKQADVPAIPSCSGLEWYNGKILAVSDDSPWLFELNADWELQSKLTLREYPLVDGRVPKALKPDYEALTIDDNNIVVLSSGSKSPTRDFGYIIDVETRDFVEIVLTDFYVHLKELAGFGADGEINIEAIAATEEDMLIFHRGNNSVNVAFELEKEDFYEFFLENQTTFPEIEVLEFSLPSIEGFVSGFSGAHFIEELEALLITSSVEATGDAYNDGEILGSFIAYITLDDFEDGGDLTNVFQPVMVNGQHLITKMETISVKKIQKHGKLNVTVASDNDTGVSEFFNIQLGNIDMDFDD